MAEIIFPKKSIIRVQQLELEGRSPQICTACDINKNTFFRGVQPTSPKSGAGLVTLFGSYSYDGLNAAIRVQNTSPKSGGEQVVPFGGYSYDGLTVTLLSF